MSAYTIVVDCLGCPPTTNRLYGMHHFARARVVKEWRDAGTVLARHGKIPKLSSAVVSVYGRYPDRRSLPDPEGLNGALKPVLDGIVAAGVLRDDRYPFVQNVSYGPPRVEPGQPPALVVTLTETEENPK